MDHTGHHDSMGDSDMEEWQNLVGMDDDSSSSFCQSMGGGMIMYMDGFRIALKGNQPCLNFLFPSWTLDTKGKFIAAMLATYAFAFLIEGCSKLRYKIVRTAKQTYTTSSNTQHLLLRLAITALHGLQALSGYVLMLVSMTFSVELFFAVVLGLASGYFAFFSNLIDMEEARHATNNPCCEFMEEESKEIRMVTETDTASVVDETSTTGDNQRQAQPQVPQEFPNAV